MSDSKRAQIVELVREKDRIEAEIQKLQERDAAIDARLDTLLKTTAPAEKAPQTSTPEKAGTKAKRQGRPSTKPAQAKTPKTALPSKKPAAKKGPTIKERLLSLLRAQPKGIDLGVLAKDVYGSDAKDARTKCESYLYNLAKGQLVQHDGPVWRMVPAAAAS